MPDGTRPGDIPDDAQPVCGKCEFPAVWNGTSWEHEQPSDAVFCELLYGGMPRA